MYIIRSGRVAIRKRLPQGGDIVVAELEKGDFFGEMAVLERIPRTAGAEMIEDGDLIVIGSDIFGDMVKSTPEIAVRMLRKYSLRLRETTKLVEDLKKAQPAPKPGSLTSMTMERVVEAAKPQAAAAPPDPAAAQQQDALAYLVSKSSGKVFPVQRAESLLGRYDSVTGQSPEIDLTHEDASRNISRRHARLVLRDGRFQLAEEIGTMNGTFVNGRKLVTGVLTPLEDGDEITLCRLGLVFRLSPPA